MPLMHEQEAVYIQIPKTGCTAVGVALGFDAQPADGRARLHGPDPTPGGRQYLHHLTLQEGLEEGWLQDYRHWYRFAFVRNPWERLVSSWAWQKDRGRYKHEFAEHVEIVERHLWEERANLFVTERPQYEFITLAGRLAADFVGRHENLQDDFDLLCDTLELPRKKLGRHNGSNHEPWRSYYTPELVDRVRQLYAEDCELFKYSWTD